MKKVEEQDSEVNNKPGRKGLSRVIWATNYSWRGLRAAWKHEAAFRQELILMFVMLPFAFWIGESVEQRLLLLGPCILVVIVELLNSAVEAVVDRLGDEYHELSGQAKDMGSAAVFCSLILVALSWGLICWDRFLR
jgi:diacylglycerol kinase (ATP)